MTANGILIIEDEPEIAELISLNLTRAGFETKLAGSGEDGLECIDQWGPELVILDLMLPGIDGLEVCRRLKYEERTRQIPIIMVTARGEEADVVTGLELGADDYMVKPFSPRELAARVRAVLRRDSAQDSSDAQDISSTGIHIDTNRHEVSIDGVPVVLTLTEFQILQFLVSRPGFVRTRDQIIEAAHGPQVVMSRRTIDVHITSLRKKLGEAGGSIETIRGVGYRIEADAITGAK